MEESPPLSLFSYYFLFLLLASFLASYLLYYHFNRVPFNFSCLTPFFCSCQADEDGSGWIGVEELVIVLRDRLVTGKVPLGMERR